ncbi:hypothetical protein [Nostoc sp.]
MKSIRQRRRNRHRVEAAQKWTCNGGTITGTILWINDPPPETELVETYGEIHIIGSRVRIVDQQ